MSKAALVQTPSPISSVVGRVKHLKAIEQLREQLQEIVDAQTDLLERITPICRYVYDDKGCTSNDLRRAESYLSRAYPSCDYLVKLSKDAQDAIKKLEPAEYLVDDEISPEFVLFEITKLVASFPTHSIPNLQAFLGVMVEEVIAIDPPWLAFQCTTVKLRRTMKFVPSIAEVRAILEKEAHFWNNAICDVQMMGENIDEFRSVMKLATDKRDASKKDLTFG